MLISCEKCATTYVLDDALIPPQGAPVQCTRCGNVFTAKPPAAGAPKPANQTQMFGTGGGPPAAPAPRPGSQTMMFGSGAAPAAPPTSKTFGTPASPDAHTRTTLVFDGPPVRDQPAPSPRSTQMFGSAPAAPAAEPPRNTLMFGGAELAAAPSPKSTQMFGAGDGGQQAPSTRSTQMFGASPRSEPARAPVAHERPTDPMRSTQLFGTGRPPTPTPAKRPVEAAAPAAPPAPAKRPAEAGEPPAPQSFRTTMMFGNAPVGPGSKPTGGKAGQSESTVRVDLHEMMREHGRTPDADHGAPPAPESVEARHDRTQLFAMRPDFKGPAAAPAAEAPEAVQERHNRTQLYAMTNAHPPTRPDGKAPITEQALPRPGADLPVYQGADTLPPGLPPVVGDLAVDGMQTLPPDLPRPRSLEADTTPPAAPAAPVTELPVEPVAEGQFAQQLDLPPEPVAVQPSDSDYRSLAATLPLGEQRAPPVAAPRSPSPTREAMAAVRASSRRRTALVVMVLLLVVLGVGGFLIWKLFGKALFGQAVPEAARQAVEASLGTLRLDDSAAKDRALDELEAVAQKYPQYVEAQAGVVLVLALQFDDDQQRIRRIEQKHKKLEAELAGLKREAERDAVGRKANELKLEHDRIAERATAAQARLQAAAQSMEVLANAAEKGSPAALAGLRSAAVVKGVFGDAKAIEYTERYSKLTQASDDWLDLAEPEYAANASSTPDTRRDALAKLKGVLAREANSTFIRPYVLMARLRLTDGDYAGAREDLEKVLAMRADHDVAQELLSWTKREEQDAH